MDYFLKPIGENIWTMDGAKVIFAGAPMHTRMTIVRLKSGHLWVHSPIEFNPQVEQVLAQTFADDAQKVCALIAPNKFHHLYIHDWANQFPQASIYAEHDLKKKVSGLAEALDLDDNAPPQYAQDIDQVNMVGNRLFREAIFFHKPSSTLIITDLMIHLKKDGIPLLPRLFLQFEQVLIPKGGIPRLFKWATRDKIAMRRVLAKIESWAPQNITFCHGEPFSMPVDRLLREQFAWLKN